MPYVGAHVSVAGGLYKGIENAIAIGGNCMQIFGSSPKQWGTRIPEKEDIEKFRELRKKYDFGPVYLHAAYLANLASDDAKLWHASVTSMAGHLNIAELIGADGLIFHTGAGKGSGRAEAMARIKRGVQRILKDVPGTTKLLMENSASTKKIGADPKELGELLRHMNDERISVCIDTAHAFEAGIIETFDEVGIDRLLNTLETEIGLRTIEVLHINDSRTIYNSQHDQHENIGEGHIGLEAFRNLALRAELRDKIWITEVPGFDGHGPDQKNMDIIKSCFTV